jgi:hypothetical protein
VKVESKLFIGKCPNPENCDGNDEKHPDRRKSVDRRRRTLVSTVPFVSLDLLDCDETFGFKIGTLE